MTEGAGPKLATAYYELIPSMAGAEAQITAGILPAATKAGAAGGSSIGAMLLGGLKKYAAPIAAIAAGFAIKKVITDADQAFGGLASTTRSLQLVAGGTAEQVSGMAGAMQLAGIDTGTVGNAVKIFSKNLGNATADGAKTSAMSKLLGQNMLDASGNVKPMADLLPGLADKFQSMPDGAQKTALAMQLFGRSGQQLIPFLNQGSAGLAQLTAQAKTAGLVISQSAETDWWNAQLATKAYSASVTGAKAALGEDLAPMLESVASIGRSVMTPVLTAMTSGLNALMPKFMTGATVISGWATTAGTAVKDLISGFTTGTKTVDGSQSGFATFGTVVKGVFSQIGAVVSPVLAAFKPMIAQLQPVFASLIPQVLALFKALSPTQLIFKALLPVLPQIIAVVTQLAVTLGGALGKALAVIIPPITKIVSMLATDLTKVIVMLLPIITQFAKLFASDLSVELKTLAPVIGVIVTILGKLLMNGIKSLMPIVSMLATVLQQVMKAVMPLVPALMPLVSAVLSLITPLLQLIEPILKPLIALFVAILKPILALIAPLVELLVPVLQVIVVVLTAIVQGIATALTWFIGLITGSKAVWSGISDVWGNVLKFFGGMWTNIGDFFSDGVKNIVSFFTGLPKTILNALVGADTWLLDIGKNMIQGLLNGAGSLLKNIGQFFLSILPSWIVTPFKAALGIHSPSTVFAAHGQNIGEGLIQGVKSTAKAVAATMTSLVTVPPVNAAIRSGVAAAATVSVGGAGAAGTMQPIMADNTLIGWIQTLANGQAKLVMNQGSADNAVKAANGKQRGYN